MADNSYWPERLIVPFILLFAALVAYIAGGSYPPPHTPKPPGYEVPCSTTGGLFDNPPQGALCRRSMGNT